jgi:CO/xanthine dehydrogenase FAD-binding subunit
MIGHVAIRNRGTVGGSVSHADPAAEWPALALALDAEFEIRGPSGTRMVPASDFFVTYLTTAISEGELLTEMRMRLPRGTSGSGFAEFARRHGDFALAGVAAALVLSDSGDIEDARVTLIGVGDRALRSFGAEAVLRGERPDTATFQRAAEAVRDDIDPHDDIHATATDRRELARVLTTRALTTAMDRARQGVPDA